VRTHVALLRGINVGGHGTVPMADLRRALGGRGCADVVTHIQSGNVALTSPAGDDEVAATVAAALVEEFGVERPVVVFGRDDYLAAVAANPYPEVTAPKQLHALFRAGPVSDDDRERIVAALAAERAKGGRGDASPAGGWSGCTCPTDWDAASSPPGWPPGRGPATRAGRCGTGRPW
jgi:uncharacterized protein (DUF1697 family)